MKTASIHQVEHNLSRILSWVAAGETVVIRQNRVPIARLVPEKPKKSPPEMPDFMARLREDYGNVMRPDSQTTLDELREDRF